MIKNWNGKPYHSLDYMLKERFGEKVYKVTLNGGMSCPNRDGKVGSGGCIFCSAGGSGDFAASSSCPNRDGKVGSGGCIFCSAGGSGDFAASSSLSITEQIESQITMISEKRPIHKYIAYFQAYTNTYAPVEYLEKIFTEARGISGKNFHRGNFPPGFSWSVYWNTTRLSG